MTVVFDEPPLMPAIQPSNILPNTTTKTKDKEQETKKEQESKLIFLIFSSQFIVTDSSLLSRHIRVQGGGDVRC